MIIDQSRSVNGGRGAGGVLGPQAACAAPTCCAPVCPPTQLAAWDRPQAFTDMMLGAVPRLLGMSQTGSE